MTKDSDTSDTFCILPWIHLSTRPNGKMRVCCTANASSVGPTRDKQHGSEVGILKTEEGLPANLNTSDLLTSWNNTYMRNVRKQMLAGEKPPSCMKCYKEEDAGHRSKRQWETAYWGERIDIQDLIQNTGSDGSVPPKLLYIDLRMGTKCNLRCIMCSPHDSSQWVKDWKALDRQMANPALRDTMQWDKRHEHGATYNWHQNNPMFWDQLYEQIPHMRQLYFAGGESTIIEEHYTLLEKVIEMGYAGQIELRYNSNGVEMPDRLFRLWDQFERVRFHYSIDSIGAMNDYIRFPSQWEHQVEQFWKLDQTGDNVEVTVACAVQVLNMYYIPDFIKWKLAQGFRKINPWPLGAGMINYHFVYHPAHLNVKILPQWFKDRVSQKYEEFYGWLDHNWELCTGTDGVDKTKWLHAPYGVSRLRGMVNFMNSEDWSNRMSEFQEYIRIMDGIRDTRFEEVFPEMSELML